MNKPHTTSSDEEIEMTIFEAKLAQAILDALEYRGFYDAGKYLDETLIEHIRPLIRTEIANARWEESRQYKKLLCDVRDILRVPEGGDIIEYAKRVINDADIYRQWQEEDA